MRERHSPRAVRASMTRIGEHLATWRRLRHLTAQEVADRADVGISTVLRMERGEGATVENLLKVARALGILDLVTTAWDPYATDVGRLRADQALPERVRHRRPQ
jgi:transcriptional regulator with XRE-family HTH domain